MRAALQFAVATAVLAIAAASSCVNTPTVDSIQLTSYYGKWYEIATTASFRNSFEAGLECTTANYSANADGTVKVDNSGSKNAPNGARSIAIGTAKQVNGGKLEVTFAPAFLNIYAPYWVIQLYGDAGSGYEVSVVYSCSVTLGIQTESVWILSRTPVLPSDFPYNTLVSKINSQGINTTALGLSETFQGPTCVYD